jgi:hypothetical protein
MLLLVVIVLLFGYLVVVLLLEYVLNNLILSPFFSKVTNLPMFSSTVTFFLRILMILPDRPSREHEKSPITVTLEPCIQGSCAFIMDGAINHLDPCFIR